MTNTKLVIVDTAQIQSYIFGSNRLRENVGASHLVRLATEYWAKEIGAKQGADLIYSGGGNYVALMAEDRARTFNRELSQRALAEAPDLELVIGATDYDANRALKLQVDEGFQALAIKKQTRTVTGPLLGLGPTVPCQSTGLPATGYTKPIRGDKSSIYPASAGILKKRDQVRNAKQFLHDQFADLLGNQFEFPTDFDDLGRSRDDKSYLAIVHADGNGMGDRIRGLGKMLEGGLIPDAQYRELIVKFSQALEEATRKALRDVIRSLIACIESEQNDGATRKTIRQWMGRSKSEGNGAPARVITSIELEPVSRPDELNWDDELEADKGGFYLPFIPIVFGGDDVTFVCDGRLGVSLAILFAERFEYHTGHLPDQKERATSCAGISIVKAHFPFSRAYDLAEELCQNAKRFRRQHRRPGSTWDGSVLDWHVAQSGLSGQIETIRAREYTRWPAKMIDGEVDDGRKPAGNLTLRPLTLGENPDGKTSVRSWQTLRNGLKAFQHEDWLGRRNKIKRLREVLREGAPAVQRFRSMYRVGPLPEVFARWPALTSDGWMNDICAYFDPLELADLYVAIEFTPEVQKEAA